MIEAEVMADDTASFVEAWDGVRVCLPLGQVSIERTRFSGIHGGWLRNWAQVESCMDEGALSRRIMDLFMHPVPARSHGCSDLFSPSCPNDFERGSPWFA